MKYIAAAVTVAAACLFAPSNASAATFFFDADDMKLAFASDGTISATFGRSGIGNGTPAENLPGDFTDIYNFIIPDAGIASGSITTNTSFLGASTDLDLTSVFFNGVQLFGTGVGQNEALFASHVPIFAGSLNSITINGFSRGNGAYGAQGTFAPLSGAVPEPATWAMLILGFGVVGAAIRRRKPSRKLGYLQ